MSSAKSILENDAWQIRHYDLGANEFKAEPNSYLVGVTGEKRTGRAEVIKTPRKNPRRRLGIYGYKFSTKPVFGSGKFKYEFRVAKLNVYSVEPVVNYKIAQSKINKLTFYRNE